MANFRSLDQFGQQRIVELPPPLRERRHRAAMRQACVPAARHAGEIAFIGRSEARRAGKEGGRTCRSRWSPYPSHTNTRCSSEAIEMKQYGKRVNVLVHIRYN